MHPLGTRYYLLASLLFILFIQACHGGETVDIRSLTVFCGSANKPAMERIAEMFQDETGIQVELIFGGSGTLLSQIELSHKGEIYLPGSPDYQIIGERKGLLQKGSDRIVAYLVPAIIVPASNPAQVRSLDDLTRPGLKLGMGNPETVCLGLYGVELLEHNEMLESVLPNVATFGGSCSKTANLAAMEQVDAILGWRVFHFWNPDRMDYVPIAPPRIPRISYIPISVPVYTRDAQLSRRFIDYVVSGPGKEIYREQGYITQREKALSFAGNASIGGEYRLSERYFQLIRKNWQKR